MIVPLSQRHPKTHEVAPSRGADTILAAMDAAEADPPPSHVEVVVPRTDRRDLAALFAYFGYRRGAEIGVEKGLFSYDLCSVNPGLNLLAVDPWTSYAGYREDLTPAQYNALYSKARVRLSAFNVDFIQSFSLDAAKTIADRSLDFVFIDANHAFEHVYADLEAWAPKVRVGGMVSGHDFVNGRQRSCADVGVERAVRMYVQQNNIAPWYVLGEPGRMVRDTGREQTRTFFWVVR